MNNVKFDCALCYMTFKDELGLNAHTLFFHGIQRGYCENPNSETSLPEEEKLQEMLKNNFKIIKRCVRGGQYFIGAIEEECIRIIKRLEQLGQTFKQSDCPDEFDFNFLMAHYEKDPPFTLYSNLRQRTDELMKLDEEATYLTKIARGLT